MKLATNPTLVERSTDGALRVSSLALAEGAGVEHRAVLQLITNNIDDLEQFGGVAFEMRPFATAGGTQTQRIALLNEQQATLIMTYLRNTEKVKAFKLALVKAFFEMAKRLAAPAMDLTSLAGIDAILNAGKAALNRAIEAEQRAEKSEARVDLIEGGKGFAVREFHKHYFSTTPEKEFNEFLYHRKLLIDQRGARGRDAKGKLKNGKAHRHPAAAGKRFFFLDPYIDPDTGDRHYSTKVRPGAPETELVEYLTTNGFESNNNRFTTNIKELSA
ncbi:Rha family transcriptional regulator [Pseudarthrobacter sp. P1]|uniref:Rha family transcriptional regulator n=1 Tax=Pseudarthrobacter sp. P1 TaxID=3418418 RepID=UPI003CF43002